MKKKEVKKILERLISGIEADLRTIVLVNIFSYKTFGTDIEPFLTDLMTKYFIGKGMRKKNIVTATNKNEFPDIKIICNDGEIAIDVKSGNHYKKSGNKWMGCNNSNNDLGTINSWPDKLEKYEGDNVYFIFVEYGITDDKREFKKVSLDKFYKYLDVNSNGVLKYREKDGNLRPKNFDSSSVITSYAKFTELFEQTRIYRAKRLVIKHFESLPKKEQKKILKKMNELFDSN